MQTTSFTSVRFPFSDRAINSYTKHGQRPVGAAQNIVSCKCTFSLPIICLPPAKETPVPSVRVTTHKRHATCVLGLYMHWPEVHWHALLPRSNAHTCPAPSHTAGADLEGVRVVRKGNALVSFASVQTPFSLSLRLSYIFVWSMGSRIGWLTAPIYSPYRKNHPERDGGGRVCVLFCLVTTPTEEPSGWRID